MERQNIKKKKMNLAIFQQRGSAESKIAGIYEFGIDLNISYLFSIDEFLPELIDDPEEFIIVHRI